MVVQGASNFVLKGVISPFRKKYAPGTGFTWAVRSTNGVPLCYYIDDESWLDCIETLLLHHCVEVVHEIVR